jgi:peptidoglycan/LPS O-acetylase OafA/YrhL
MSEATESDHSLWITGVTSVATATVFAWGQRKPGFDWDKAVTGWIREVIPSLDYLSGLAAWPLRHKWAFATAILLTVVVLSLMRYRKTAAFVLASVAGGLLSEWVLQGLKVPLAPVTQTLFYGTFVGGLAMGLHPKLKNNQRGIWWGIAGVVALLSGLATIGSGLPHPMSAWGVSVLLVVSWLLILDQLMR